jgi:hypothetical protein
MKDPRGWQGVRDDLVNGIALVALFIGAMVVVWLGWKMMEAIIFFIENR